MKSSAKICVLICIAVILQCLATAYPRLDMMSEQVFDDLNEADSLALEKRRMGWGLCDGFFKWRCGKERVVIRGKK